MREVGEHRRTINTVVLMLVVMLGSLSSAASRAQSSRPLTVWVDTLTKNVCDTKSFQLPVWISDLYYRDSIAGFSMTVYWDRSKFDLEDVVGVGSNTILRRTSTMVITVSKDPTEGILYLTAADTSLTTFIAGQGKPLLYLVGSVTAPDTIARPDGWVQVKKMTFESVTSFEPITYRDGYVQVVRDTTPAFTGRFAAESGSFDTLRVDTITVSVENVSGRHVREVAFSLAAERGYFSFADTLESGTLAASVPWQLKEVSISSDTLRGRFVLTDDLATEGPLLKIILRRETDSAFDRQLVVTGFRVNAGSCLGRLEQENARIMAIAIRKDSTAGGVSAQRHVEHRVVAMPRIDDGSLVIDAGEFEIEGAILVDRLGRQLPLRSVEQIGRGRYSVRPANDLPSGSYFLVLRSRKDLAYEQFVFIK